MKHLKTYKLFELHTDTIISTFNKKVGTDQYKFLKNYLDKTVQDLSNSNYKYKEELINEIENNDIHGIWEYMDIDSMMGTLVIYSSSCEVSLVKEDIIHIIDLIKNNKNKLQSCNGIDCYNTPLGIFVSLYDNMLIIPTDIKNTFINKLYNININDIIPYSDLSGDTNFSYLLI